MTLITLGGAVIGVVKADGSVVHLLAGGVWSQRDKTAVHSAECVFECCFDRMRAVLTSAIDYLDKRKITHNLPDPKGIGQMVVEGLHIVTQQDHASAQLAQEREMKRVTEERAKVFADGEDFTFDWDTSKCADHKRTNIFSALNKGDHEHLTQVLGPEKDPGEYGSNIVDTFMLLAHKEFGHHAGAYVYGKGVFHFQNWLAKEAPNFVWKGMEKVVGSRNDVMTMNALPLYYMRKMYARYLVYLEKTKEDILNLVEVPTISALRPPTPAITLTTLMTLTCVSTAGEAFQLAVMRAC
jgi:hypothetical protein